MKRGPVFDEFDAIGAMRAGGNDVGEIRRVLNSFLQFLEQDDSESLIVGAMAASLQADYPNYWPETIRGLMVHSAEWTPGMLEEFPFKSRRQRFCGECVVTL